MAVLETAGQNYISVAESYENAAKLNCLTNTVRNQNSFHEWIRKQIEFGECLLPFISESSRLLSKTIKIKITKLYIILPVTSYGCGT
jgi:hypothetical protein